MGEAGFIFSLARMGKALRRELDAAVDPYNLTPPQFQVLYRLWQGDGILTTDLSKDGCSDAGTITGVLDRLEEKELIRRERSAQDRRAVRIYLTDAGRQLQEPLMSVLAAVNAQALEGFTPQDEARLLQDLDRISANLGAL